MKQLEVQEVFSLDSYSVIKAKYGESNYYVAGKHDITQYVQAVARSQEQQTVNKTVLELGLQLFFRHNPQQDVLSVPKFDLVLLDDKKTSAEFVMEMCMDLFHFSEERAIEAVTALNSEKHAYTVGTFSEEMCITYCAMFENANAQLSQNIGYDYVPSPLKPQSYEAALQTLETLIRRDYPNDI
jgi:ATP-dependent Clp protease adapter protein ClpS